MTLQANTNKAAAAASAVVERAARDERTRFKRHFPMLILEEAPDARGQLRFLYPHVESMFAGWNAAHAQLRSETSDSERLNFLIRHEARVIWSADRICCAVFHNNEDGDLVPMLAWGEGWPTAREAIDAVMDAQQGEDGAA